MFLLVTQKHPSRDYGFVVGDTGAPPSIVPELTPLENIKFNERHSLRRREDRILITALKTGFDFHDRLLSAPWHETND